MTKQDNLTALANYSILFVTISLLGSFVVSFNFIDLAYLLFFYGFIIAYKLHK